MDASFQSSYPAMLEFQAAWAATVIRRMENVSSELLTLITAMQKDPNNHEVVRSLLTYVVAKHGSAPRKKELRDNYANSPFLVQLATIHASDNFVTAEKKAFLSTASAQGELEGLITEAVKQA